MLCITNSQLLPSTWSAYIHCYHKVARQAEECFLKGKSHKRKHKPRRRLDVSNILNVPVQPSYIDRLIPAFTILDEEFELSYNANRQRFLGSGYSPSKQFLQPKNNFRQVRTFKLKSKGVEEYSGSSKRLMDEDVLELAKQTSKSLNFNSREAISYCLGLQEGINMKSKDKQAKDSFLSRYGLTALVVGTLAYMGYRVFMAVSVDRDDALESMNQRDFQADVPDVSFDDVKGIEEVKQELQDVVEFLKDPEKFTALGGKLPKGILLSGPPGTGKTLLARAVAGEAGVPFYYASGSEFDEMFVGVGSARIRSLFSEAKENSPCIVFIDEIDACGSARTSSPLQPYARQTINQLLQEMDGFQTNDSVIVLAATNMKDVLDKALTRPGRFDTEVAVMAPDLQGRKEILQLYVDRIVHGNDLDLEKIACLTGGMTGAALSNLVNQAALRAGHLNKGYAEMCDFEYALDKLRMGPELKSRIPTESELELTAFHEAGHALIAFYSSHAMPIYKATITQRGAALGHVSMVPTREDESGSTSAKMLAQIDVCMGGRVAEEILKGKDHVTTGGSSDLQTATGIAFEFVCTYGMSDGLGFVAFDYDNSSPETKRNIEMEVRKLLENSYKKVKNILSMHSHQHKLLAKALIKYQTLTLEEIKTLLSTQNIKSIEKLRNSLPSPAPKSGQVTGNQDGIPSPI